MIEVKRYFNHYSGRNVSPLSPSNNQKAKLISARVELTLQSKSVRYKICAKIFVFITVLLQTKMFVGLRQNELILLDRYPQLRLLYEKLGIEYLNIFWQQEISAKKVSFVLKRSEIT